MEKDRITKEYQINKTFDGVDLFHGKTVFARCPHSMEYNSENSAKLIKTSVELAQVHDPNTWQLKLDAYERMKEALEKIAKWELPETGEFWDEEKTRPVSYEVNNGSNGVRDYIRSIASEALK